MSELLLLENPGRKRRKRKSSKRKGKMPAGLKKYWASKRAGKKSSPKRKRYRRNPAKRTVELNERSTPVAKKRRSKKRYRNNPFGGFKQAGSNMFSSLKNDVIDIGVAFGTEIVTDKIEELVMGSIPDNFKGLARYAIQAFGLPYVVKMLFGANADMVVRGVKFRAKMTAYNELKKLLPESISGSLSGNDFPYLPGYNPVSNGMYLPPVTQNYFPIV